MRQRFRSHRRGVFDSFNDVSYHPLRRNTAESVRKADPKSSRSPPRGCCIFWCAFSALYELHPELAAVLRRWAPVLPTIFGVTRRAALDRGCDAQKGSAAGGGAGGHRERHQLQQVRCGRCRRRGGSFAINIRSLKENVRNLVVKITIQSSGLRGTVDNIVGFLEKDFLAVRTGRTFGLKSVLPGLFSCDSAN